MSTTLRLGQRRQVKSGTRVPPKGGRPWALALDCFRQSVLFVSFFSGALW